MNSSTRVRRLAVSLVVLTLLMLAAVPAMGANETVRVFVQYEHGHHQGVQQALSNGGAHFIYDFPDLDTYVVKMPAAALNGIMNNPHVVMVEEDVERSLDVHMASAPADTIDPTGQTVPYGVDAVQARDVWDADRDGVVDAGAPTGDGITVCIIDTGYYADHEDLMDERDENDNTLVEGFAQLDGPFTTDGNGHGSHVAGTIAAMNNGIGVVGVSPGEVELYIVKFFGNDGLATNASDLIEATGLCQDAGASVISMSLGGAQSSNREKRQFDNLYAAGILSIAAAGNDGVAADHYPSSYDSVVSVAATDANNVVADFSQFVPAVELAGPGVSVLSTVPYTDVSSVTADGATYSANHVEFSARGTASGAFVDGGLCTATGAWTGQVVLCERGEISFYDKMMNVQNSGGAAAIIYNNEPGNFFGTLGDEASSSTIIGVSLSQEDGQYLVANKLGATASISSEYFWPTSDSYEYYDGTSMATPHVSAVAALVWSSAPTATNAEIRDALQQTALDLGAPGRDDYYGFGLVQAADAIAYLGGSTPPPPPPDDDPMTMTITTDKAAYVNRETVTITAHVEDEYGAPIAGAAVSVTLTTPKGKVYTFTGTTDANGDVTFTQKINLNRDGSGTFNLSGSATAAGYIDASATAVFTAE